MNVKVTGPAVVAALLNVTVLVSTATLATVVSAAKTPVPPVFVTTELGTIPATLLKTISVAGLGLLKSNVAVPAVSGAWLTTIVVELVTLTTVVSGENGNEPALPAWTEITIPATIPALSETVTDVPVPRVASMSRTWPFKVALTPVKGPGKESISPAA